jgi:hypothetical protein
VLVSPLGAITCMCVNALLPLTRHSPIQLVPLHSMLRSAALSAAELLGGSQQMIAAYKGGARAQAG